MSVCVCVLGGAGDYSNSHQEGKLPCQSVRKHTPLTHSHSPRGSLESPINLTNMFLDSGRKLETPHPSPTGTGKTHQPHTEKLKFTIGITFVLQPQ